MIMTTIDRFKKLMKSKNSLVNDLSLYKSQKKINENRFKRMEKIETMHLISSFNYWFPIEMTKKKPYDENNGNADDSVSFNFCDFLPPGKHYFYFVKNNKYFTLCKRYKIGRFKECKNVWLNYIEVEKEFK